MIVMIAEQFTGDPSNRERSLKAWFPYDRWRLFTITGIASKLFRDRNVIWKPNFYFASDLSDCQQSQQSRSLG